MMQETSIKIQTEQLIYDETNFLGEFGGHLGLFLGGSILSCIYVFLNMMIKIIAYMKKVQMQKQLHHFV